MGRWSVVLVLAAAAMVAAAGCSCGRAPATRASAVIGPSGGTLALPDGTSVSIPAGALAEATEIVLATTSDVEVPESLAAVGPTYELTPHGLAFALPVTVRLAFVADRLPRDATADDIVVYTGRASPPDLVALETETAGAAHVRAETDHFSVFVPGVAASESAAGCDEPDPDGGPPDDGGEAGADGAPEADADAGAAEPARCPAARACTLDRDCPNGGSPTCDGDIIVTWKCGLGRRCQVASFGRCDRDGEVCRSGGCHAPCRTRADCRGGEAGTCHGNVVARYSCLDSVCVPFLFQNCRDRGPLVRCVGGSCVQGCEGESDCAHGGAAACEGIVRVDEDCVGGTCVLAEAESCLALGQACLDGACVTECDADGDCARGGAVACEGTVLRQEICVEGTCTPLDEDCADYGGACAAGECVPSCESDADCPAGGDPFCEGNASVRYPCVGGTCTRARDDCGAEAPPAACSGGACVPACEDDGDCTGGGGFTCVGDVSTRYECVGGACLRTEAVECPRFGRTCTGGTCELACDDPLDCPAGGHAYCQGDTLIVWDCISGTCGQTTVWDCAADGARCSMGACVPTCGADADCPGGGRAYCDGDIAATWACVDGECVEADAQDCTAGGGRCLGGLCVPSFCDEAADCPAAAACEGTVARIWDCWLGLCVVDGLYDCAQTGETCRGGLCVSLCETDLDCAGPEFPLCIGPYALSWTCLGDGTCALVDTVDCSLLWPPAICEEGACVLECAAGETCSGGSPDPWGVFDDELCRILDGVPSVTVDGAPLDSGTPAYATVEPMLPTAAFAALDEPSGTLVLGMEFPASPWAECPDWSTGVFLGGYATIDAVGGERYEVTLGAAAFSAGDALLFRGSFTSDTAGGSTTGTYEARGTRILLTTVVPDLGDVAAVHARVNPNAYASVDGGTSYYRAESAKITLPPSCTW